MQAPHKLWPMWGLLAALGALAPFGLIRTIEKRLSVVAGFEED